MAWLARRSCAAVLMFLMAATPFSLYAQVRFNFNLPEQELADALRSIGAQTHVTIAFDPAIVASRRAPALKGRYTAHEALDRILHGSHLRVRITAGGSFWIEAIPVRGPSE